MPRKAICHYGLASLSPSGARQRFARVSYCRPVPGSGEPAAGIHVWSRAKTFKGPRAVGGRPLPTSPTPPSHRPTSLPRVGPPSPSPHHHHAPDDAYPFCTALTFLGPPLLLPSMSSSVKSETAPDALTPDSASASPAGSTLATSMSSASSNQGDDAPKLVLCRWQGCSKTYEDPEDLYVHLCNDHVGRKSTNNLCLTCRWEDCDVTCAKRDHITSHLRGV